MGKAVIDYGRKEGYVVCWFDQYQCTPLRNFGDYKSAAIEFRDHINNKLILQDGYERRIQGWAKSYNPSDLYSYPEISSNGSITLRKQKYNGNTIESRRIAENDPA